MPYFDLEGLIGWYDGATNRFLCNKCFYQLSKKKRIEEKDYEPVKEDALEGGESMYICDECGERWCY